jgi:hypothetical protein
LGRKWIWALLAVAAAASVALLCRPPRHRPDAPAAKPDPLSAAAAASRAWERSAARIPWAPDRDARTYAAALTPERVESAELRVGAAENMTIRDRRLIARLLDDLRNAECWPCYPLLLNEGFQITFNSAPRRGRPGIRRTFNFNEFNPWQSYGLRFWRDLRLVGKARAAEVRSQVRAVAGDVVGARIDEMTDGIWAEPRRPVSRQDLPRLMRVLENATDEEFAYNDSPMPVIVTLDRSNGQTLRLWLFLGPAVGPSGVRRDFLPPPLEEYDRRGLERYIKVTNAEITGVIEPLLTRMPR